MDKLLSYLGVCFQVWPLVYLPRVDDDMDQCEAFRGIFDLTSLIISILPCKSPLSTGVHTTKTHEPFSLSTLAAYCRTLKLKVQ